MSPALLRKLLDGNFPRWGTLKCEMVDDPTIKFEELAQVLNIEDPKISDLPQALEFCRYIIKSYAGTTPDAEYKSALLKCAAWCRLASDLFGSSITADIAAHIESLKAISSWMLTHDHDMNNPEWEDPSETADLLTQLALAKTPAGAQESLQTFDEGELREHLKRLTAKPRDFNDGHPADQLVEDIIKIFKTMLPPQDPVGQYLAGARALSAHFKDEEED